MTWLGLGHYVALGGVLFSLGIFGVFFNRRNLILVLMSVELALLGANVNFVAFGAWLEDAAGQVFALFVMGVAASEAALGLAILVLWRRGRAGASLDEARELKG